jgi:hypothetical protein
MMTNLRCLTNHTILAFAQLAIYSSTSYAGQCVSQAENGTTSCIGGRLVYCGCLGNTCFQSVVSDSCIKDEWISQTGTLTFHSITGDLYRAYYPPVDIQFPEEFGARQV